MRRNLFICLLLAGMTLTAFWPVGHLGFLIHYDDNDYVTKNPGVQAGITGESIGWAFTTSHAGNWHPVTWLSHMLDCQLFGLNPGGHHWMNLGFHIANTLLLFFVLRQMTTAVWSSAFVAALFALHPTHVQSVAWVSERKDLLCGFFMMLTLLFYTRYAQNRKALNPSASGETSPKGGQRSTLNYTMALVFFALGLMSKPMLVTLPVILLLLDYWPLQRFTIRGSGHTPSLQHSITPPLRLFLEKLPFLALSLASCVITFQVQQAAGFVAPASQLQPWYWRIVNSLVFYSDYLEKMFWPVQLAIFYPYTPMHLGNYICSALLPVLLTFFCLRRMCSQTYLPVGWFWFVVMLVPVIGLVQVGLQAIADRYTYLPSIGLFIAIAWSMAAGASVSRFWRTAMTLGATTLVLACLLDTRYQLRYWRDSVTLFSHAIEVTGENPVINYYLGVALMVSGNPDEAAKNYRAASKKLPDYEPAHYRLGYILLQQKKYEEAKGQFDEVLRLNPDNIFALKFLGDIFSAQGKYAEAEAEYAAAMQPKSDKSAIRTAQLFADQEVEDETTFTNLYNTLKDQLMPEVHLQVGFLRATRGEYRDAVEHYLQALRLKPDSPEVLNNLAWLLATCPDANVRDGQRAIQTAERACTLTDFKQTLFVGTLAAAYAEAGRFDEAVATAQKACALAEKSGQQALLKRNRELLALYFSHQPYHEAAKPLVPAAPNRLAIPTNSNQ